MRKKDKPADDLRPEYDLRTLLKRGVRGKYAQRYQAGTNLVLLDPEIARAFPSARSINEALRLVLRLTRIPNNRKLASHTKRTSRSGG